MDRLLQNVYIIFAPRSLKKNTGHFPFTKIFHAVAARWCAPDATGAPLPRHPRVFVFAFLFATSVFELFFFFFFDAVVVVVVVVGCFSREKKPLYPKATTRTPARGALVVVVVWWWCCCCCFREPREKRRDDVVERVFGVLEREHEVRRLRNRDAFPVVPSNGGDVLVFTRIYRQLGQWEVIEKSIESLSTKRGEKSRPRYAVLARDEFELFELVRRVGVCVRAECVWVGDARDESVRNQCRFPRRIFSVFTRQIRVPHVATSPRRVRVRVVHRFALDRVR